MATYNLRDKASLEMFFGINWQTLSKEDLNRAYRKKALEYHPDKNPNGEAMFKQLSRWYTVLNDPKERRILEVDLSAFNRADIHRTSTFNTAAFSTQHSADTRQTYHSQSRKTAQQAQAKKEFDEKLRREESEARRSTGRPLKELLAEQAMAIHYIAITNLIYEIKKQLNASGEDLSQVTATSLSNQIAQVRVKIAAMLSDNYIYKNILIKDVDKKKSLENELPLQLTTLEKDIQNKINRPKPSKVQTTAPQVTPKVRRMHQPFFPKTATKPEDTSHVNYRTHLEDLANDLLSTPKKQDDISKRRKLDHNKPGRFQEMKEDLQATDLDWEKELLRNQPEAAQKVTLENVESRPNTTNLEDVFDELLKVYTNTSAAQQRNPEQVTRLTEQAIAALRNMRHNTTSEQASWRRKRTTGGGGTPR